MANPQTDPDPRHCEDDDGGDGGPLLAREEVMGSDALPPTQQPLDHFRLNQAGYRARTPLYVPHLCHCVLTSRNRSAGYQTEQHSHSHTKREPLYCYCL